MISIDRGLIISEPSAKIRPFVDGIVKKNQQPRWQGLLVFKLSSSLDGWDA